MAPLARGLALGVTLALVSLPAISGDEHAQKDGHSGTRELAASPAAGVDAATRERGAHKEDPFSARAEKRSEPQNCWSSAAAYHGVDPWLLYSIAWVESRFKPAAIGKNKNGSMDMGMMQINSIWFPELLKYGIRKAQLHDPCTSIFVGAWILKKSINRFGYTWRAIGAYNSANPAKGYAYAKKVYAAHRAFTGVATQFMASAGRR